MCSLKAWVQSSSLIVFVRQEAGSGINPSPTRGRPSEVAEASQKRLKRTMAANAVVCTNVDISITEGNVQELFTAMAPVAGIQNLG